MFLSLIIPVYNEEKRISKTIIAIDAYLRKAGYKYEIIVVNENSTDKTSEVVHELMKEIPHLSIFDNPENHGKGYAVREGMTEGKGEYLVFTDADLSTPIQELEKMIPLFKQGYDVVIGSRDVKGAILDPPQPLLRRVLGDLFKLYRKIVLGMWEIEDTQCGFKGFTKKATEDVFPLCKVNGFAFDPEILILAKKKGYKIKEMPITWKNDLESKIRTSSLFEMAAEILKIRLNLLTHKYGKI